MTDGGFIDLGRWERRDVYQHFRDYETPYFHITAEVDASGLHRRCLESGASLFLATLHLSLRAAHRVEPFLLRLRPEGVWRHGTVGASSTVPREDGSFGFGQFPRAESFAEFQERGRREVARIRSGVDPLEPYQDRDDVIHFSVLPWIRFTSLTNALRQGETIPKVVFGRLVEEGAGRRMPVSVGLHHALADGVHVARFLEALEEEMRDPEL